MNAQQAVNILKNIQLTTKSPNDRLLSEIFNHCLVTDTDLDNIDHIRDNFGDGNITWDSTFKQAIDLILGD